MFLTLLFESILGHSPFQNVTRPQRRLYALLAILALALVILGIGYKVGGWAAHNPMDATDPRWIQATASKVAHARQWWVYGLCAKTLVSAYLTLALLYRTPLGKVFLWWNENKDTAESQGAKTANAGRAFCALLVGYAILFSRVLP